MSKSTASASTPSTASASTPSSPRASRAGRRCDSQAPPERRSRGRRRRHADHQRSIRPDQQARVFIEIVTAHAGDFAVEQYVAGRVVDGRDVTAIAEDARFYDQTVLIYVQQVEDHLIVVVVDFDFAGIRSFDTNIPPL